MAVAKYGAPMTILTPGQADLTALRHIARDKKSFALDVGARPRVEAARKVVDDVLFAVGDRAEKSLYYPFPDNIFRRFYYV